MVTRVGDGSEMKRQKTVVQVIEEPKLLEESSDKPLCWETFFQCQRSPALRSQLLAALLSGTQIVVERLPQQMLLDVVLLAFAARVYCDSEIVDNWAELLRRTEEEWERPDWTCRIFDSIHTSAANNIVHGQVSNFTCAEEQYIPDMAQWYLDHDLPEYFSREIEEVVVCKMKELNSHMSGGRTRSGSSGRSVKVKAAHTLKLSGISTKKLSAARKKAKK
jgi:hypothetical protein